MARAVHVQQRDQRGPLRVTAMEFLVAVLTVAVGAVLLAVLSQLLPV